MLVCIPSFYDSYSQTEMVRGNLKVSCSMDKTVYE